MLAKSEYSSSACPHDFLSSAGLHWQTRPQFRARQTIAVRTAFRLPFCQKVDVRITRSTIEVFFDGNRICSHRRLYGRANQYSTIEEHMPPNHQQYVQWNGDRFRKWAEKIGTNTQTVISAILGGYKVEQQGYKACMGLLKLADKYTPERLENACRKALTFTPRP